MALVRICSPMPQPPSGTSSTRTMTFLACLFAVEFDEQIGHGIDGALLLRLVQRSSGTFRFANGIAVPFR